MCIPLILTARVWYLAPSKHLDRQFLITRNGHLEFPFCSFLFWFSLKPLWLYIEPNRNIIVILTTASCNFLDCVRGIAYPAQGPQEAVYTLNQLTSTRPCKKKKKKKKARFVFLFFQISILGYCSNSCTILFYCFAICKKNAIQNSKFDFEHFPYFETSCLVYLCDI